MKTRHRSRRAPLGSLRLLACGAALLLACSKSGDATTVGGGGGAHAPSLSSLDLYPRSAAVNEGSGSVSVGFIVIVKDPDADVVRLAATVLGEGGAQVGEYTWQITDPPGETQGMLSGSVPISTAAVATFTIRFQAFDGGDRASNVVSSPFSIVAGNPLPAISSLSPTSTTANGPPFTLTVTGTGFLSSSYVSFGSYVLTTTYVDASTLQAQVPTYALYYAGAVPVTVSNAPPGGGTSAPATFTIDPQPPNPAPTLTSISPTSVDAGSASFTLTATGTDFVPSSYVVWNGYFSLSTAFVDATTLHATVPDYLLTSIGTASVTVTNPTPGGGTSSPLTLTVKAPAQAGVTTVSLQANDLAWDPYQQKLYLSVPSLAAVNPNTITVLDPFTGTLTGSAFAGSEPARLVLSEDGQFLYVALRGASSVNRLALPGLTQDLSLPVERDSVFGQYYAGDLAVAPSSPHTLAVTLFAQGFSPSASGGLVIYDDATIRPTRAPGFPGTGNLFDSIQWGSTASVLYAGNDEDTGFDFYVLAVDASGVTLTHDYGGALGGFGSAIHFDAAAGLVYTDLGRAIDPSSGGTVGTFATAGLYAPKMVPDSSLGSAFFVGPSSNGSSTVVLKAYDLDTFVPTRSKTISYVGTPTGRLVRWGPDGVAFLTASQVVLVRGATVLPVSDTPNPTPSVAALSPASATAGAANFQLAVSGSGFVPGSVVQWNGSDRCTRFTSATQLVAFIPASDVASAGSASVTVTSPSPGGGTSTAATFPVNP
jgi:hypothetical protein